MVVVMMLRFFFSPGRFMAWISLGSPHVEILRQVVADSCEKISPVE
jgi:hypothetical protein